MDEEIGVLVESFVPFGTKSCCKDFVWICQAWKHVIQAVEWIQPLPPLLLDGLTGYVIMPSPVQGFHAPTPFSSKWGAYFLGKLP